MTHRVTYSRSGHVSFVDLRICDVLYKARTGDPRVRVCCKGANDMEPLRNNMSVVKTEPDFTSKVILLQMKSKMRMID